MATIYDMNGETIIDGLQGSKVCNDAIDTARRIAVSRGVTVTLEDDDGTWLVFHDGRSAKLADGAVDLSPLKMDCGEEHGHGAYRDSVACKLANGDLSRVEAAAICGMNAEDIPAAWGWDDHDALFDA